MSSDFNPIEIEFDCPVCGDTVVVKTTKMNNITPIENRRRHLPGRDSTEKDNLCNVSFSTHSMLIRREHDWVEHKLPIIYTCIDEYERDIGILRDAVEGIKNQGLGVSITYSTGKLIHGWKREDRYFGATKGIWTPYNVHSSNSVEELHDYLEMWFDRKNDLLSADE
jgi:hypothetical protein